MMQPVYPKGQRQTGVLALYAGCKDVPKSFTVVFAC